MLLKIMPYPVKIRKADTVAKGLQYHLVRSLSTYRSIIVVLGRHFGREAISRGLSARLAILSRSYWATSNSKDQGNTTPGRNR